MKSNKKKISIDPKKYDLHYFQKFNRGFECFKDGKIDPIYENAFKAASSLSGKNIKMLDVGCGRGEIVYLGALRGWQSFGIDYSEQAVSMARDFIKKNLPKNLQDLAKIELMDARELKYENRTFDIIFMLDVVEHLCEDDLENMFIKTSQVLKPTGKIIIHTTPNRLLIQPVRLLARLFGIHFKSDEFHINEQTVFSLKSHLKKYFDIQNMEIKKDKHYWSNGTPDRGPVTKYIAKAADWFADNFLIDFIITKSPLKFLFGTDIWAVARPKIT